MDHSEVVRLQAVEKYMLGELSPELRDQFEEHYFDCPTCAADVTALHTFMAASRMILKEEAVAQPAPREGNLKRRGWFDWLRPAVALPAMAALAAVIVFQAVVTIPWLERARWRAKASPKCMSRRFAYKAPPGAKAAPRSR